MLKPKEYQKFIRRLPIDSYDHSQLDLSSCIRLLSSGILGEFLHITEREARPWQTIKAITQEVDHSAFFTPLKDITPASLYNEVRSVISPAITKADNMLLVGCVGVPSLVNLLEKLHGDKFKGKLTVIDRSPRPLAACKLFLDMFPIYSHGIEMELIPTDVEYAHHLEDIKGNSRKYDVVMTDAVDPYIGTPSSQRIIDDGLLIKKWYIPCILNLIQSGGIWITRILGKSDKVTIDGERLEHIESIQICNWIIDNPGKIPVIKLLMKTTALNHRTQIEAVFKIK